MSHIILIIRIGTKSVKKEHSFCCLIKVSQAKLGYGSDEFT